MNKTVEQEYEDMVNNAHQIYEEVAKTFNLLYKTKLDLERAKRLLEEKKLKALLEGKIDGKNAEVREALTRELFSQEYQEIESLEEKYNKAKFDYDVANLTLDEMKFLLRLLEAHNKGD